MYPAPFSDICLLNPPRCKFSEFLDEDEDAEEEDGGEICGAVGELFFSSYSILAIPLFSTTSSNTGGVELEVEAEDCKDWLSEVSPDPLISEVFVRLKRCEPFKSSAVAMEPNSTCMELRDLDKC